MKSLPIFQLLFLIFLSFTIAPAQTLDMSFVPTFGGNQESIGGIIQRPDGKFVVNGGFQVIGNKRKDRIALLNSDGSLDSSFDIGSVTTNVPQASVYVSVKGVQPDNKILISGSFTHINGVAVTSPVRLNPDGSLDASFNAGGQGTYGGNIYGMIVLPDGKILMYGLVHIYNNQNVPALVRLNSDGSLDSSFYVGDVSASPQSVTSLEVQPDGKIIATGDIFSRKDGHFLGIARFNEDGSLDTTFSAGGGANNYINGIKLLADGKILISGSFITYNGVARRGMARINANGSLDTSFVCNINVNGFQSGATILATLDSGQFLISGSFDDINGIPRKGIARINNDGSLDQSFTTVLNSSATQSSEPGGISDAFVQPDQKILVVGYFFAINQTARFNIARLNSDGTTDLSYALNAGAMGYARGLAMQPDGKLLVVGSFSQAGGIPQYGITRLNLDGSVDLSFATGYGFFDTANSTSGGFYANAVAVQNDGKILIGGNFGKYNNVVRPGFVRVNTDGTLDTSFTPSAGIVNQIVIQNDNKIVVVNGGINRFNPDGSRDTGFNVGTGANGTIGEAVLQPDGKIIIVGSFTTFSGTTRNRIARLNPDGSLDTGFSPSGGANTSISSAALQPDGKIVVVGNFTLFNNTTRNRIARINADGSLDTAFDPGAGADAAINKVLLQPNGNIIIGGSFNNFAGVARKKFAGVLSNGAIDASFGAGLDWYAPGTLGASVYSLFQTTAGLFVTGNHTRINNQNFSTLSKFNLSINKTPFDFDGDHKTDISIFRPSVGEWWYYRSSDGGNYAAQFGNSADRLVPGDYTGDGRADIAVFRPATGEWLILRSEDGSYYSFPFGTSGDIPAVGDFDGDGKADSAVFRPSDTTWYIRRSSDGGFTIRQFGAAGDVPAVADYDGDGKSDIAIWRASVGEWWILKSSDNNVIAFQFGNSADKPVQGDYTGDGKADIAIYRPSTGEWFILRSEDFSYYSFPFGTNGDVPAPGDYDGDGKADAAVFRPSQSTWYVQRSTNGTLIQSFGIAGDVPVPNAFVP